MHPEMKCSFQAAACHDHREDNGVMKTPSGKPQGLTTEKLESEKPRESLEPSSQIILQAYVS